MSTDHDRMNLVDAWLREEEQVSAARIVDDVLDQVGSLPQRRARWAPAWFRDANRAVRLGLTTAAAVVIGVVVVSTVAPGRGGPGGPAASLQPSASAPREPDALPTASATGLAEPAGPWSATGPMVTVRAGGHSATLLADGRVLVAGGFDSSHLLASAELLDRATLTWVSTGDMNQARTNHTATRLADGRVLVVGGGDDINNSGNTFSSAELYDPATGIWEATGSMTQGRVGHSATLLPDGTVLVAGGGGGQGDLDSVEIYDPDTGTWASVNHLIHARGWHSATLLSSGRVLVVGGVIGGLPGCCMPLSSAEMFDPRTGSWTETGSLVDLRGGSEAVSLLDGSVLVAGEINGGLTPTAERYDPASGTWSPTTNMHEPRINLTVTLLADGRVLFAAGTLGHGPFVFTGLSTAQIYDPITDAWVSTHDMIASRGEGPVAVSLADGRVLLVGGMASQDGRDGPTVLSDPAAEVYDPTGGGT